MTKLFLTLIIFFAQSCGFTHGVFFDKKEVNISFNTYPDGASVWLNGKNFGKTPITTNLIPNGYYDVVFIKDGYSTKEFRINPIYSRNGFCKADTMGSFLIIPLFSAFSTYCRTFPDRNIFKPLDKVTRGNVNVKVE